ncbi:SdpI family protein [Mycobacteroides saopaulense]|uniref:SdpI family protein n=1 Tax=Mycobacteroides saopaulense TaxID=1578165 RepID=A0ABX3BXR7_9MYCO|nr:SdpI family protein [Mycobacteroides saopaulense]OHT86710.1 hypothetical protein BKG68_11370 [Mycobacteroides saopaulense]OHU08567.1 hypothetical protein BKG73_16060 [Mycobacteroides saopaulense]
MHGALVVGTQLIASAVLAAIVLLMTWRAATGRLPRNQMMGIRIPCTMASEQAWRAGHRAALPVMSLLVVVMVMADVAAIRGVAGTLTMSLWAVGSVAVIIVATFVAASAARKASD